MYQKMDKTNDGLMNAYYWRLDNQPNIVALSGMVDILERTAAQAPQHNVYRVSLRESRLRPGAAGRSARTKPEFVCRHFCALRGDRADSALRRAFLRQALPTDWFMALIWESIRPMYRITFRILESLDEHFYEIEQFSYHWSLNGFGLQRCDSAAGVSR